MGSIEQSSRSKRRIGQIQRAVLSAIAISGILAVAVVAPNTLQLMDKLVPKKYQFNYQTRSILSLLAKKGYIRFIEKDGRKCVEITRSGKSLIAIETARLSLQQKQKKRWDKRWRFVVFDIPERYKNTRNQLRETVRECGFFRLQDSVWIFPYDCEEFVSLLKTDLRIGSYVLYAVVESIENDQTIRNHFNLK